MPHFIPPRRIPTPRPPVKLHVQHGTFKKIRPGTSVLKKVANLLKRGTAPKKAPKGVQQPPKAAAPAPGLKPSPRQGQVQAVRQPLKVAACPPGPQPSPRQAQVMQRSPNAAACPPGRQPLPRQAQVMQPIQMQLPGPLPNQPPRVGNAAVRPVEKAQTPGAPQGRGAPPLAKRPVVQSTLKKIAADVFVGTVELIFGGSAANSPGPRDKTYKRQSYLEQAVKIAAARAPISGVKQIAPNLGLKFPGAPTALSFTIKHVVSLFIGKVSPPAKPNAAPVKPYRARP